MNKVLTLGVFLLLLTCVTPNDKEPLYYGWFFNQRIASGLEQITDSHLQELNSEVPDFQKFLVNASSAKNVTDPLKYYKKPVDPNTGAYDPFFHVTAQFCGNQDCTVYTNKVEKFLNVNFSTELVGLFLTSNTFGIRVNLSQQQLELFANDKKDSQLSSDISVSLNVGEDPPEALGDYPGIEFTPQDSSNFHPTDTKAHVTVGCAPGVAAVTTGDDLIKILELETQSIPFCQNVTVTRGNLIQMGENCDIFVLYLNQKMTANATFQVYETSGNLQAYPSIAFLLIALVCSTLSILK